MPKPPHSFFRLDNTSAVKGSTLVTAGTPNFASSGTFGKAFNSNNASNRIKTANFAFSEMNNFTECAFEMWLKPNFAVTNGAVPAIGPGIGQLMMMYVSDTKNIRFRFYRNEYLYIETLGTTGGNWALGFGPISGMTWSAGDWVHLAIVINASSSALGGSNKVGLFFNGSKLFQSTVTPRALEGTGSVSIGHEQITGSTRYLNGLIDNFKMYNYPKIDYSDRFRERGGLNDIKGL